MTMIVTLAVRVALVLVVATTTSSLAAAQEHHGSSGWKELDAFHTLMAATWHPAKSGDLAPIRAKADSLSIAAKRWSESPVPKACDTAPVRAAIADVAKGSAGVAALVARKAPDAEIRAALHDVHERFEVVEHGCHP